MVVLSSYILENNPNYIDVCVANGPAPALSELNSSIFFYLSDGSCGELIDRKDNYALIESYFPALNQIRQYWVPRSQLYISFKNSWS